MSVTQVRTAVKTPTVANHSHVDGVSLNTTVGAGAGGAVVPGSTPLVGATSKGASTTRTAIRRPRLAAPRHGAGEVEGPRPVQHELRVAAREAPHRRARCGAAPLVVAAARQEEHRAVPALEVCAHNTRTRVNSTRAQSHLGHV